MDHVGYEIQRCADAADTLLRLRLTSASGGPLLGSVHDSHVESMAIHARNAREFLLDKQADENATDLYRSDFTGDGSDWAPSTQASIDAAERLQELRFDTNTQVSHLTWDRVDRPKRAWRYTEIASDVTTIAAEWAASLRDELYAAVRPAIAQAEAIVASWPKE
jgi:hypothetical protein